MKYGDRKQMLKALWQMRKYGEKDFYHGMKDFIWRLMTKWKRKVFVDMKLEGIEEGMQEGMQKGM